MSNAAQPVDLVSGEGVAFDLRRAGVGSRLVAASLDLALQLVELFVLLLFEVTFMPGASGAAIAMIVVLDLLLVLLAYPLLMEWLNRGRTLGKMAMGLRAVRDDGGPISFRQALVRSLCGLLIEKPGLLLPLSTCVGVLTLMLSSSSKRLGDMMAGTFVLNERSGPTRQLQPVEFYVPYPLQGWASTADLSAVSDQLALSVRQFVARAYLMTPAAVYALGEQLKAQVLAVVSPAPPWDVPAPDLLQAVLAERRRRSDSYAPQYQPMPQYQLHYPPQYQPVPRYQQQVDAPPHDDKSPGGGSGGGFVLPG